MNTIDIKHLAVERIFLIPDASDGQLGYVWCDDPGPSEHHVESEAVEYVRKDVHDAIIAKQANAAKRGMDAAKKVAGSELEQAKRLHAECDPQALESEREANAVLTEQIAELEQERDALAAHVERLAEARNIPRVDTLMSILEIIDDAPATSLARRDLLKQAEALGVLAERKQREAEAEDDCSLRAQQAYAAVCAANESNKLRQQAEGYQ